MDQRLADVARRAANSCSGVEVKTRRYLLKTYHYAFIGTIARLASPRCAGANTSQPGI